MPLNCSLGTQFWFDVRKKEVDEDEDEEEEEAEVRATPKLT